MRWYIGRSYRDTAHVVDSIVGVLIAPDDVSMGEVKELMERGGYEIFIRPRWDDRRTEVYWLMTWEEVSRQNNLCEDVITGVERGTVWTGVSYREFLVLFWEEVVRKVAVEPLAIRELDLLCQRKGSFRRAKEIIELLRLLNE